MNVDNARTSGHRSADLLAARVARHEGFDGLRAAALLDLVPELGWDLEPAHWTRARSRSLVQIEPFPAGEWVPQVSHRHGRPDTALLVAGGVLVREVEFGARSFAELLGTGDLIHPWAARTGASTPDGKWRALLPGTLAVVDEVLLARVACYPSISLGLARLATRRGRFLAALAITRRLRRVEPRLLFLFALLAERWGRVTPDGVVIRLPLNHELLASLVGARRPAVTTALGHLRERGALAQLSEAWLLSIDQTAAMAFET